MKIRTFIVDDEPLARERIRLLLQQEPDLELAGEFANGHDALPSIDREAPDLLFLDVQMPEMDGFQLLEAIPRDRLPVVIFTTAYNQHALQAFEHHALDYLLKPFKPARFKESVQRARERIADRQAGKTAQGLIDLLGHRPASGSYLTRLSIKSEDRTVFVKTSDIDSIESAGNYVVVHMGKENHILRETLAALEGQLDPDRFLRISRSSIVNLDRVRELQPMFKGEHVLILTNGRQLPMTRGVREVEKALKYS